MTEPEEKALREEAPAEEETKSEEYVEEDAADEDALLSEQEREAKKGLRKAALLLILFSALLFCAFTAYIVGVFHTAAIRKENYHFVGFSPAGDVEFAMATSAESLEKLPLSLEKYNARVYYDGLTGADRLVYRAFEVALDHGWEEVYLDSVLVESCRRSPTEILVLLALDSPFLEQNIRITEGHHFTRYVSVTDGSPFGMMAEGTRIIVDNFAPGRLEKKKAALKEAEKIASSLSGETDREKAQAIFAYLLDHVEYAGERGFDQSFYLYDTLIREESNCDGFTNSFALLATLSGLRVFEKDHQPPDGSIGHTWNCVMMDGIWYNVDVTYAQGYVTGFGDGSQEAEDETLMALYATFGFPDARQKQAHDYEDLTPPCEAELIVPDLVLESQVDLPLSDLICAVMERENRDRIFLLTNFALDSETLQQVANRVGNLRTSFFAPSDKEYCYVIRVKGDS